MIAVERGGRIGVPARAPASRPWTREAWFTLATLVGLVGGGVAEWWGAETVAPVLYGIAYLFGGWYGARAGLGSLREGTIDIDLLMILAAVGALAIGSPFEGAMLLFLFSLSNTLQKVALGRSRGAIQALMKLRPDTARVRRGDEWVDEPVESVAIGSVIRVGPGDRIPLDGIVLDGRSSVDQASLTGESVPVSKVEGDEVFAGTTLIGGAFDVRVSRVAIDSAVARMVRMVEEAQSQKAATQRVIDRIEQPYAVGVIVMTLVAAAVPLLRGAALEPSVYRAITLMVAASPCALVLSTPAAVLSAIAASARAGVLFKGGVTVEEAARVRAVAFDKTGTLTAGETRVTDIVSFRPEKDGEVLMHAAACQSRSEHHLARATLAEAAERGIAVPPVTRFVAAPGLGVEGAVGDKLVRVGNVGHFRGRRIRDFDRALEEVARLEQLARTAVIVTESRGVEERAVGVMAFADVLRPSARTVVADLRALGVEHVVMLTGDAASVGEAVAAEVGIDVVHAELLPENKVEVIRRLGREWGGVAMVGDGVNDAPALAAATLGVAMGGVGTDTALETADVVLMEDDLRRVPYLLGLAQRTRSTLIANIAISIGAMLIMVVSILLTGLPLPAAVVGHEGSTVVVSLNGLRLLRTKS